MGSNSSSSSSRTQQSINKQGLYVLVKEAVVPKEAKISKEGGIGHGKPGFFILLKWFIGVFLP